MTLGDRVKALREEREFSRAKLAHDAGVSYAFVQQLETGVRKDPGVKHLAKIAAVLGYSVDSILSHTSEDAPSPLPASGPVPGSSPSRVEIDQLLDGLSPDELVSARDLLRVWFRGVRPEMGQRAEV